MYNLCSQQGQSVHTRTCLLVLCLSNGMGHSKMADIALPISLTGDGQVTTYLVPNKSSCLPPNFQFPQQTTLRPDLRRLKIRINCVP